MKHQTLKVRPSPATPNTPWLIDIRIDGKRRREFFKTKAQATEALGRVQIKTKNEGHAALSLSDSLRVMAVEGDRRLQPYGWTIRDAVNFTVKHLESCKRSKTVQAIVDEYLSLPERKTQSEVHKKDLRNRFRHFCAKFGGRLIHEVTTKEVKDWLYALDLGPVSFNNFRDRISYLFSYAVDQEYLEKDPVAKIKKTTLVDRPPDILTVDELARLLEHATPELLPALVIGAFTGLRTAELMRLEWKNVNLVSGELDVPAAKSKTAARRLITMEANLMQWLAPYGGRTGKIWNGTTNTFNHSCNPVRRAAGIQHWPANGLRHSFGTYHMARYSNAARTALDLGHSGTKMVFAHYRAVVSPKEGERYFSLFPPAPSQNVVQLPRFA
jgi:integrase